MIKVFNICMYLRCQHINIVKNSIYLLDDDDIYMNNMSWCCWLFLWCEHVGLDLWKKNRDSFFLDSSERCRVLFRGMLEICVANPRGYPECLWWNVGKFYKNGWKVVLFIVRMIVREWEMKKRGFDGRFIG